MRYLINYLKSNKKEVLIVLGITLLALLLRVVALLNYGDLWVDELWSFYFADKSFPFGIITGLFKEDIHVPLFFLILSLWIKIFGTSEIAMRILPLIFSVTTIPIFYLICKKIFSSKIAYPATIFLAISSFHIYYAKDIKYYSLITLLITISSYYFVKILENNNKKDFIKYIIFSVLSVWTFNVAIIFVFIQFLYGVYVLSTQNKDRIKAFLTSCLAILILSSYIIVTLIIRIFMQKNALMPLVSHFEFDLGFAGIMVRNFFSNNLISVFDGYAKNYSLLKEAFSLNIIFVTVPSLIGLFGLIKALLSKNKTSLYMIIPPLLFMVVLLILAFSNIIMLLPRYFIMLLPMFIAVSFYGLSLVDNKKVFIALTSIFLAINATSLVVPSITPLTVKINGHGILKETLNKYGINKNDIIFSPISGHLLRYYFLENKFVDFSFEKFYTYNSQKRVIFDEDVLKILDKENFREYFENYILEKGYSKNIERFLLKNYISKMTKNEKFVLIVLRSDSLKTELELYDSYKTKKAGNSIYNDIVSKFYIDTIKILNKNLTFKDSIRLNSLNSNLLIYEKE